MQNQYVGDIGDFGKYGLLREIFGRPEVPGSGCGLRLGVAWYLNVNKPDSGGKTVNYPKMRKCDPYLYDSLQRLIETGKRKVAEVERKLILPSETLYHNVPFSGSTRTQWFKGALKETEGAEVVFIVPDNGIASKKTPLGSPKHVLPYELDCFFERGQSLVIYHHFAHFDPVTQIESISKSLSAQLDLPYNQLWALRYHRGSGRVYFFVAQKEHKPIIWNRLQEFKKKPCWFERQPGFNHPHFELVTPTED